MEQWQKKQKDFFGCAKYGSKSLEKQIICLLYRRNLDVQVSLLCFMEKFTLIFNMDFV